MNNSGLQRYWLAVISIPDGEGERAREREGGRLISLTGLTQGDQRWIETHITHTHTITRHRRSVEVPLHSHTLLSVYIFNSPAAAMQLNLLTGRKTTKASLTDYMLNTHTVCVCVCVSQIQILLCKHT